MRSYNLGAMKFPASCAVGALFWAGQALWGQEPPAAPPPAPAALPAVTVLENNGKPMLLPFHCTDEDIQWAGLTCSAEDPCPIYLELTSLATLGSKIITAGNLHSAAVTMSSVVLVSEDAGHTWTEAHERIRGTGLDHIQFLDADTAWISGASLFPLPQDPFLLLTTDGGKPGGSGQFPQRAIRARSSNTSSPAGRRACCSSTAARRRPETVTNASGLPTAARVGRFRRRAPSRSS